MAHTHLHRPSAALEALAALAGVKSGLDVYVLRILAIILGAMLSLGFRLWDSGLRVQGLGLRV
jgi:hypothetical protein